MMERVFILVIDSLGVGSMSDVVKDRPQDVGANTFYHILDQAKTITLPAMEELGIYQLLKHPRLTPRPARAGYGALALSHFGADSYAGHQEIMGTIPAKPHLIPFVEVLTKVKKKLEVAGFEVTISNSQMPVLLVNQAVIVGDNIETDYGQIYNVSGCLDRISFAEVVRIGQLVRQQVAVSRVIALGGQAVSIEQMLKAVERREDGLVGMNCPKSGIYNQGYLSLHLGYGVERQGQVSSILTEQKKEVTLIGKMQDVISCPEATKIPAVPTDQVMIESISAFLEMKNGLVAATVQETDLAGHAQDVERYAEKLMLVDQYLTKLLPKMKRRDLLMLVGDHGNDPTIGHSQHTREKTILLAYSPSLSGNVDLGIRTTLADVGATVADFLGVTPTRDGISFLQSLKPTI